MILYTDMVGLTSQRPYRDVTGQYYMSQFFYDWVRLNTETNQPIYVGF